jgi:hypothetical protein
MEQNTQLATTNSNPFVPTTIKEAETIATWIAKSGCFGIKTPEQALTIMMIANSEGQNIAQALKRYHVFDDGKLSQRSDYTQAEFEKRGTILWHVRTGEMVAATFFRSKDITDEARQRAKDRFKAQYALDALQLIKAADRDREEELQLINDLTNLSHEGEATIIRTLYDAELKGITKGKSGTKTNWHIGAVNMLQWRCVSDGVKLIDPLAYAGTPSDVEMSDVKIVEQSNLQQAAQLAYDPKSRDREAMQAIIDDHLKSANEAKTAAERQRYLGLAAEMRVKLADLDGAAPQTIEAEVMPPPEDDDQLPGLAQMSWRDYGLQHVRKGTRLGDLSTDEIDVLYEKRAKPYMQHAKYGEEARWIAQAYEATRAV